MALATAYALFASADTFFTLIDRALDERDLLLRAARVLPPFDRFRSDPRYRSLLEKVGLSD